MNNKESTHYNFNGKTNINNILDLCIISTNLYNKFISFEVLKDEDMTSDHLSYVVSFNFINNNTRWSESNSKQPMQNTFKRYNFKKADWNKFRNQLPSKMDDKNHNVTDTL